MEKYMEKTGEPVGAAFAFADRAPLFFPLFRNTIHRRV
jgi:hypothetical protein